MTWFLCFNISEGEKCDCCLTCDRSTYQHRNSYFIFPLKIIHKSGRLKFHNRQSG